MPQTNAEQKSVTPIFWINLDRRTDRRAFMEEQFAALGLTARRFAAVSPATIEAELGQAWTAAAAQGLAVSELCVTASHRAIWRTIRERGLDHALILEDDAVLSPALEGFAAEAADALAGLDVIRIETGPRPVRVGPVTHRLRSGLALRQAYSAQWGTAGYVIGAACAGRLLDDPRLFSAPLDQFMFDPTRPGCESVAWRQCAPGLCIQGDQLGAALEGAVGSSDVTGDRRRARARRVAAKSLPQKLAREGARLGRQAAALARDAAALARGVRWTRIGLADDRSAGQGRSTPAAQGLQWVHGRGRS